MYLRRDVALTSQFYSDRTAVKGCHKRDNICAERWSHFQHYLPEKNAPFVLDVLSQLSRVLSQPSRVSCHLPSVWNRPRVLGRPRDISTVTFSVSAVPHLSTHVSPFTVSQDTLELAKKAELDQSAASSFSEMLTSRLKVRLRSARSFPLISAVDVAVVCGDI